MHDIYTGIKSDLYNLLSLLPVSFIRIKRMFIHRYESCAFMLANVIIKPLEIVKQEHPLPQSPLILATKHQIEAQSPTVWM